METDLHLLSRYHRHGDAEAFQSLVLSHAGMVHATAARVTKDFMLAQDVAQETFLALARSSGGAIQSVGAWLHHVAWQKARDVVRGDYRRQSCEAAAAQFNQHSDDATWRELEPQLDESLAEMPEQVRAIIVERFLEGRTQQELAARMGVSQSTVSRQLDAAIDELRSRLRTKGVLCCAGLTVLLSTHSASAAPAGLAATLGKVSISGVGTHAAITPAATITTTLIAMTTTSKLIIAAAAIATIIVPMAIQKMSTPPPKQQAAQAKSVPILKQTGSAKNDGDDQPRHYRPAPVTREVRVKADNLLRRVKNLSLKELQTDPELSQLLERFTSFINTPEMQEKTAQRQAAILRKQGSKPELMRMDDSLNDSPEGRAFVEALVSDEPERMEEYMLNKLDGAVFEFAFDPDLKRSSTGVSFQAPAKPKPKAKADPDQKD